MTLRRRCALFLLLAPLGFASCRSGVLPEVRLVYFHGSKSYLFYRTYSGGYFKREGVAVGLYSEFLGKPGPLPVPMSYRELLEIKIQDGNDTYFGKVSGTRIAELIEAGEFSGGTMGESSFVEAVSKGAPLVAVAMLAHDLKEFPAKALVLRKDLKAAGPRDLKGLTLISRRGGPGEAVMLREFLESVGLRAGQDVTVRDQVPEELVESLIREGRVDGGLYHVSTIRRLLKTGSINIYRRMDWMDPEISHGLLVFHRDFLRTRPQAVEKVLRAYVKRIRFENGLSDSERRAERKTGPPLDQRVEGMNLPQTDDRPFVRLDLLERAQDLLVKHRVISSRAELADFVDTAVLGKVLAE